MILRYIVFGILTTIVSLAVYYATTLTFLNPALQWELQLANIISWIISVAFAYLTNRQYVFHSINNSWLKECIAFFTSRLSTLVMDMLLMFIFVSLLAIDDRISKLIVQIAVIVANYVASKLLVFRNYE